MSNRIVAPHRDHLCAYDEDRDLWECEALDLKAKTLKALRTKIDQIDRADRNLGEIPVWILSYSGAQRPGHAVLLTEDSRSAFCVVEGRRVKESLTYLALRSPENDAAVERLRAACKAETQAVIDRRNADAAVPRASAAELMQIAKERRNADH